jgi:uncharacterized protein (TIRG00374 family)
MPSNVRLAALVKRVPPSVVAGYAAAVILLWLFLRNTDWTAMAAGVRTAAWPLLLAAVAVRLAALVVAALRWQALLAPAGPVPLGSVMAATMMGMTATTVAPMQAAEFVRPYVLSRWQGVDYLATLATAVAEWFLDALAVLALFVPAALWLRAARAGTPAGVAAPVAFLALAIAALAALRRAPRRIGGFAGWIESRQGLSERARRRATAWCQTLVDGLRTLERPRGLMIVAAYSLLFSVLTALSAWLTLTAFELRLSPIVGFFLLGLVTVAGMSPTPGAVGGFHAVCQLGLMTFFGIDRVRTVLPVIALHGVLYLPGALLGVVCVVMWPVRLRRSTA